MGWNWAEKIPEALAQKSKNTPVLGYHPAFDTAGFLTQLQKTPPFSAISCQWNRWNWSDKPIQAHENDLLKFAVTLAPIEGLARVYISKPDAEVLSGWILETPKQTDPEIIEGTLQFSLAALLMHLQRQPPFDSFSLAIREYTPLQPHPNAHPGEFFLCIDLLISKNAEEYSPAPKIACRLCLDTYFYKSWITWWREHPASELSQEKAQSIPLTLHLEVGQTELPTWQYLQLRAGDWLALDKSGYQPTEESTVSLKVGNLEIGCGKLAQGRLTVTTVESSPLKIYS